MTVRVFVGCAPSGDDAESMAVLEHSLRSRCSLPVEITWMQASRDPQSLWCGWDLTAAATPFSPFRWSCAAACGFKGRAIYCDSDVVWLGDAAALWRMPLDRGQCVAARDRSKFCVSLWDCEKAQQHMLPLEQLRRRDGHQRQSSYFRHRPWLIRSFGPAWNYLDDADDGSFTKVVHYTDLRFQPSFRHATERLRKAGRSHWYDGPVGEHPRREIVELFDNELEAAKAAGYTVERYIPAEDYGPFIKRSMKNYARGRHVG
jgi:hypothetical protein